MENVINLLDDNNIKYEIIYHNEVHTIEDMEKIGLLDKGYVCKNLFLRNASGKMHFVLSCHHTKKIQIQEVAKKIGSTRLSFGSDERLKKYLNLESGYVSPFGVINDESKSVIFIFDEEVKNQHKIGFHPNTNKATVYLDFNDVKKIIEDHGNEVVFIKL